MVRLSAASEVPCFLIVTGLVNVNVHEVIKPLGTLGLDIIQRPVE